VDHDSRAAGETNGYAERIDIMGKSSREKEVKKKLLGTRTKAWRQEKVLVSEAASGAAAEEGKKPKVRGKKSLPRRPSITKAQR
jgi:hypothetical protein